MVAPADPNGVVRAGAPARLDHSLASWGYVMGGTQRLRRLIALALLAAGAGIAVLAFLLVRLGGNNLHEVQAGKVYRAAELDESTLAEVLQRHGIRTVLRLVGTEDSNRDSYAREQAVCAEAGITLEVAPLATSRPPRRKELLRLFEVLDRIAAGQSSLPMLVHCSAGSDRTGLVSVIWLHDYQGVDYETARRQLAFTPYMHVRWGEAGVLDDFLAQYEKWRAENPSRLSIRDWTLQHYRPGT